MKTPPGTGNGARDEVIVRRATWDGDREAITAVRRTVFVREQGVPEAVEMDGRDAGCRHVLAVDPCGRAVGTGRLLPDGHIGRLAVLAPWRQRGIGHRLLGALMTEASRRGLDTVALNAQTAAVGFYEKAGFAVEGGEFLEAGIRHVAMSRRLDRQ